MNDLKRDPRQSRLDPNKWQSSGQTATDPAYNFILSIFHFKIMELNSSVVTLSESLPQEKDSKRSIHCVLLHFNSLITSNICKSLQ